MKLSGTVASVILLISLAANVYMGMKLADAIQDMPKAEKIIQIEKKYYGLFQFITNHLNEGRNENFSQRWRRGLFGNSETVNLDGWKDPYSPIPE